MSRWNISSRTGSTTGLTMAEPQHRVAPQGSSTGQSIREYNKSHIREVREICKHYVKKCSGKYHKNEAAARYVHQMAEEIVSQLAGVADEIKKHQGEPEMFQALLDEWTANFPPSLGEFGSPRAIAAKLARQELEIADLKDAFESAVAAREKDVTDILRSMDAQLHAYRGSVMSERQQQKVLQDHRISSYEQAISDIISKHDRELEEVSRSYARGAEKAKTEYSYSIAACNSQISLLKTTVEENKITYERQLSDVLRQKDGEIAKLTKHLQIAEEKYYSLADRFDEEVTVLSDYFTDMDIEEISAKGDTEEKDMGDGGNVSSPNNIQQNKRSKKRVPKQSFSTDHNSRNRAEEQASISRSRAATIGLNELNKLIESLTEKNMRYKDAVVDLSQKVEAGVTDLQTALRRIKDLEKMNEALRIALQSKIRDEGMLDSLYSNKIVSEKTFELCHTPHFLGPSDKAGICSGPTPRLTGYRVAGHY